MRAMVTLMKRVQAFLQPDGFVTPGGFVPAANDHANVGKSKAEAFITTGAGEVHPFNPHASEFHIEHIANSLSKQVRFNGHLRGDIFYSVAQHSVYVGWEAKLDCPWAEPWGLMHDSPESVIGDMVTPIKRHMPEFVEMEHGVERCIVGKYKIERSEYIDAAVKRADRRLLYAEGYAMHAHPNILASWGQTPDTIKKIEEIDPNFTPMLPRKAKQFFLDHFYRMFYAPEG